MSENGDCIPETLTVELTLKLTERTVDADGSVNLNYEFQDMKELGYEPWQVGASISPRFLEEAMGNEKAIRQTLARSFVENTKREIFALFRARARSIAEGKDFLREDD